MEIERIPPAVDYKEPTGIAEFADAHNLTMTVRRWIYQGRARFSASFKGAEVKEGCMLVGKSGNGDTEDEAIADYARSIDGALLVFHTPPNFDRLEIRVPSLMLAARSR